MIRNPVVGALLLLSLSAAAPAARAEWPKEPSLNFAVADRSNEQVVPLIKNTADGGVYIAWMDRSTGSYVAYLQRLAPDGTEMWAHNGLLVSSHPQNSALFGWDMTVTVSDEAVLVFSDIRDGGDLDTFAYKIGPAGQFLWGPDGIQLSVNATDFDASPRVAMATDGDAVFVWNRSPNTGDGDIRMQRIAPDGTVRYPANGLPIVAVTGESPSFAQIVPAENGTVILSWLRNTKTLSTPRHLRARKFDATGTPVWPSFVTVYDAFTLPVGYYPEFQTDGANGCFLSWYRSDGVWLSSFAQHLDAAGAEIFPHQGVALSTNDSHHHVSPTMSVDTATGESIYFWDDRSSGQNFRGIYGQKLSAAGVRQWSDIGIEYMPLDTVPNALPHGVPYAGGAMFFLTDQPDAPSVDRLIGYRVDGNGALVWGAGPLVVSSATPGTKGRYPVVIGPDGVVKIVWEDTRNGAADLYVQNVNPGGTLGPAAMPGAVGASLMVAKSAVTEGDLTLSWGASCSVGASDYAIYEGVIGDFASHVWRDCSDDGGDFVEELTPSPGSRYYLIVPLGEGSEGSYGQSSLGVERPRAPVPCKPVQQLGPCQ